jgi:hypothetical protein
VYVTVASIPDAVLNQVALGPLNCTLTGNNGAVTSCTSNSPFTIAKGQLVMIVLANFTNAPLFSGAHVYTSFTCD